MISPLGPKKVPGALAPLFDRLIDEEPELARDPTPQGFLEPEAYKASIVSEITTLLNTRSTLSFQDEELVSKVKGSIPGQYGIKNLATLNAAGGSSWRDIETNLEEIIALFEPRLQQPKVTILQFNPNQQDLKISLIGNISWGNSMERIEFSLNLPT